MKHVHFIRGRYVVRVTVPPDLRAIVGKRELVEPLGGDKKLAERKAHAVIGAFLAKIEEAQERKEAMQPTLSSAAKAHFRSELEADAVERRDNEAMLIELRKITQPRRASLLRLVASGQIVGEEADALIGYAADALQAKGIAPDLPRPMLLKALAEAQLDALAQFEARDQGKLIAPEPKSPLLTVEEPALPHEAPKDRGKGATLTDVLAAFHRERTAGKSSLAPKTMDEHRVAVRMFEEFMGSAVPARSLTTDDILAYKNALIQTPNRYTLRFPGLTLPRAIRANEKREEPFPTLDSQTINMKWLSHLRAILKWGSNNGFVVGNVASGISVDQGKGFKEPSRTFFTPSDIQAMFSTELFARPEEYGSRQWALLLALYTGARSSSEIARVKLSDIYEEQGINVIHLEEASKNTRSKRLVPVHSALIRLGLLEYVAKLKRQKETRLFPDWMPEDKINRWFLRTYKKQVGIEDSRKVFHSFRNTMKTALARQGVNRDVSDLITGHKDQTVSGVYIGDKHVTMIEANLADTDAREEFFSDLEGLPCFLGMDLAINGDLAAIAAAWRHDDGRITVHPWFFVPGDLREKSAVDGVPYERWHEEGLIFADGEPVIPLAAVEDHVRAQCARFDVREIACNPHLARQTMQRLLDEGMPAIEMPQRITVMGPAIGILERTVNGRTLRHAGHPVLRHHFDSVVASRNDTGLVRMHKGKKTDRIDGAVAAAMAVSRAALNDNRKSIYDLNPDNFDALWHDEAA